MTSTQISTLLIRRPRPDELVSVKQLVQTVVDETYGTLWSQSPLLIQGEDWSLAWVAATAERLVGVVLTSEHWIEDLWVHPEHQGRGLGKQLLHKGEEEIANRGFDVAFLRVVKSNSRATAFYRRHSWDLMEEFAHETLPVVMLRLEKHLSRAAVTAQAYGFGGSR